MNLLYIFGYLYMIPRALSMGNDFEDSIRQLRDILPHKTDNEKLSVIKDMLESYFTETPTLMPSTLKKIEETVLPSVTTPTGENTIDHSNVERIVSSMFHKYLGGKSTTTQRAHPTSGKKGMRRLSPPKNANQIEIGPQFRYHNTERTIRGGIYGKPKTAWYGNYDIYSRSTTTSQTASSTEFVQSSTATITSVKVLKNETLHSTLLASGVPKIINNSSSISHSPGLNSSTALEITTTQAQNITKTHRNETGYWKYGEDFAQMMWRNRGGPRFIPQQKFHNHSHQNHGHGHNHSISKLHPGHYVPSYYITGATSENAKPTCTSVIAIVVFAFFLIAL